MATTTISIDVDVDDVIDAMPDWHKEDLCQYLITMGYRPGWIVTYSGLSPGRRDVSGGSGEAVGYVFSRLAPADVAD
jgi:hypothetical protein